MRWSCRGTTMRAKHAQRVVVNAGCGSVARLDSRQIVCSSHAGGATGGNVSGVAGERGPRLDSRQMRCSSHAGGATGGNVSDVAWDRQGGGYPEPPQDGPEG